METTSQISISAVLYGEFKFQQFAMESASWEHILMEVLAETVQFNTVFFAKQALDLFNVFSVRIRSKFQRMLKNAFAP